jgi:hypothetical protein
MSSEGKDMAWEFGFGMLWFGLILGLVGVGALRAFLLDVRSEPNSN